jgi:hypothetical protein
MSLRRSATLLSVCLAMGCQSKEETDFSRFHGIYRTGFDTFNPSTCDTVGEGVVGSRPLLVLYSFFAMNTGKIAIADSCSDVAACQDRAKNPVVTVETAGDFSCTFSALSSDGQGLTGAWFSPEISGSTAEVEQSVLLKTGDDLHIEVRQHQVPCQMKGGECDEKATIAAAASTTCKSLRVVDATFQERL